LWLAQSFFLPPSWAQICTVGLKTLLFNNCSVTD
jgi:hypothetical protein